MVRKTQKDPDAFRTISEVSDELDVPQHVLRFWETKFAVVKPLKRGGGRRYYRPADVELIRGIRDLLYTHGFTIKGAQKLLKEQGGKIGNIDALKNPAPVSVSLTSDGDDSPADAAPAPTEEAAAAAAPAGQNTDLDEGSRARLHAIREELKTLREVLASAL
ncbi:hypothetical protein GCM10007924_28660 [Sneathiella chinensis]|uniref:HTH merR-type domain-containing protein n=2 Tax=Sneathiella chinensis TaxID=349750 RepID=A0ABQ5U8Y3_9PROT|nr:hypothetical protein GCM10007924_28660 [Sneathiella chinensis]